MIGAMYNKLQELQFELYVAKQIKDEDKYREIQKQIENLEQQIKSIQGGNNMNEKVHELLNQQINKEFYSAYLYLDFSNYFKARGLDGFANWYMIQAQEERDHAMLFYTYLQNEDQVVTLDAIAKPDKEFTCDMDVLLAGLEHEKYVTSLINDIYGAAYDVRDFRTMQFLDWFVKEQGEEETNAKDLITKMELFGSDPKSLYMLNQELAARIYSAPSLVL
jgi:ferritin